MIKRIKKSKLFGLLNLSLSWLKAIARIIVRFLKFALGELISHILFGSIILGFSYVFVSWGISSAVAFNLALATLLAICILLIVTISVFNSAFKHQQPKKVKIKLATWLAKTLIDRTSPEWTEYQDWLHDIFLARRQLLDAKSPKWKVTIITYWRLSAFLTIVTLSKIKNMASSVMRLR